MVYNKPKLIDLNSFPVTAFGQCKNGSGANQRGCSTGGDVGPHLYDCGPGNSAAGYDNTTGASGCTVGTTAAARSYCSSGGTVATLGNCTVGSGYAPGTCGGGSTYVN